MRASLSRTRSVTPKVRPQYLAGVCSDTNNPDQRCLEDYRTIIDMDSPNPNIPNGMFTLSSAT